MVLSSCRIGFAKSLLNIPNNQIDVNRRKAKKLVNAMNHYYLSPMFLLLDGPGLKRQLEKKYNIESKFSFWDLLANITVLFTDELLIIITLLVAFVAMYWVWLPAWRMSAFNHGYVAGYNTTFGADPWVGSIAFQHSCDDNYICQTCREAAGFYFLSNGTIQFGYTENGDGGCDSYNSVSCSSVENTWVAATANAYAQKNPVYVDPASNVNGTYLTYYFFGRFESGGNWDIIICYRDRYAKHRAYNITPRWVASTVFIMIGAVVIYIIVNSVLCCCYEAVDVD